MAATLFLPIAARRDDGRIVGELGDGEDRALLADALLAAPDWVAEGRVTPLVLTDHNPHQAAESSERRQAKRRALADGALKRYAFRLETQAGPRIVKVVETRSFGSRLLGWLGTSGARHEHALHRRTQMLGLAAAKTLGFLEWRSGLRLLRSAQIQTPLEPDRLSLEVFLARELLEHGDAAVEPLAAALATLHGVPFFHADLKGYHAFVDEVRRTPGKPATYRLVWIDLGRVAFWMSPRKRIINLYQVLRFVLAQRPQAHSRFVAAYCRAAGWRAKAAERVLAKVRRFLAYKIRTVPAP